MNECMFVSPSCFMFEERGLWPEEFLRLMGMPRGTIRFQRLIDAGVLSAADVRSMSGNGLHCVTAAGAFISGILHLC